jgi:osmoprotectant transport system permease protein
MGLLAEAWQFVQQNPDRFWEALAVHVRLSLFSLGLALLIFLPLGVLIARGGRGTGGIIGVVAAARVVPSLAILLLLLPVLGLGEAPALVALTVLAGPPLVINTDAGLRSVAPAALEAARGIGMTGPQVFWRVQVPLALPVIVAGTRTAGVEIVASAALAALIGAGGLGQFITSGLTLRNDALLLVGAIPVTLLALGVELGLGGVERALTPPGLARL